MSRRGAWLWLLLWTLALGGLPPKTALADAASATAAGVAWLQGRLVTDGTLLGEAEAMALPLPSRADAAISLGFGEAPAHYLLEGLDTPPLADEPTEFLARRLLALRLGGGHPAALAQALAARQNDGGGYGPAPDWPETLLDTAWAGWALGVHDPALAVAALDFLRRQIPPDGGLAGASPAARIQTTALAIFAFAAQPRTAANLTTLDQLAGWLLRQRAVDGVWQQDLYLTALSLAALTPQVADPALLAGGQAYLLTAQQTDGSWAGDPFLTAWALRALLPQRAAPPADPALGALSGRLLDAATGFPVTDAPVTLSGAQTFTVHSDAEGRFSFTALPAGHYDLAIVLAGYQERGARYPIAAGQTVALGDLPLTPLSTQGAVRGIVTDATGQPLEGVSVSLTGHPEQVVVTDASGGFQMADVPPGDLTLAADLSGYWPATGHATLQAGQTLLFSPSLYAVTDPAPPAIGHFQGTVIDAETRAPLPGVPVELNGVPLATTGPDGRFDLELAPNAYEFRLAWAGYQPLAGHFLLTAGSLADAGPLALAPTRTLSTLSGQVTHRQTGAPVADAQVELVGLRFATTDQAGRYRFDSLAAQVFDVRVAAPGYTGQLWRLEAAAPADLIQDFALEPSVTLAVALDPLHIDPPEVGLDAEVAIRTTARSTDTQPLSLVPTLQIVDATGAVVGTAQAGDEAGQLVGAFTLDPGASRALVFRWNSGQFPPGDYRLVARLSEAGTLNAQTVLGRVVAEQAGALAIAPGSRLTGSLTADPPVVQAGTDMAIQLSSILRNAGNTDWPARRYRLEAVHVQTETRSVLQEQDAGPVAVGALLELPWADWTPTAHGDYRLELGAADAPDEGAVTGQVYVGEAAAGLFTLDRQIVPKGTQTVRGTINVTGTDAVTGSVSDPLLPLIKQAVQKAVDYNDPNAAQWTLSNRCLGCHVATQALVGGEVNRDRASFNAQHRNTLLNAITTYQQSNGALYASHPEHARTQSILGLWALDAWHDKSSIALTLTRVADYLVGGQEAAGSWYPERRDAWWTDRPANTAVTLKSLIEVRGLLADPPADSLTSYTRAAWITGQGLNGTYYLANDADGNVYVSNYNAGTAVRVKPDGTVEPWLSGLTQPLGIAVAADGTTYVASPTAIHRRTPDGTQATLAARRGDGLTIGPDGHLYASDASTHRIVRITADGQVSDYLVGGPLRGPRGIAFTPEGDLLVANHDDLKILKIKPDKTVETVVTWTNGNPRGLVRYGDGWLVGTTTGLYRYRAGWQGERLSFAASDGLTVTPDGRIVTGDGGASLFNNSPTAIDTAPKLAALDAALGKATNWLLNDANTNAASHLDVAFRMMGLGAARKFYEGQPLAETLLAKLQQADALLRSRQRADGGWGRHNGWASDAMVTAMVGLALDELSPSPQDPVIRRAIQWLLSLQAADGSWSSQNGILSTRLAATTWVAIWLPVAMDRIAGIDTDLTLALPADLQLAQPSVAPRASAANAHGGLTYTWNLRGVTRAGQSLGFDLTFQDLALHETRPAAREAYLTFTHSLTGQPVNAPLTLPAVTASAFLGIEVGTDRAVYGENDTVAIAAPVTNLGATLADGHVHLAIQAADGTPQADLGTTPVAGLLSGQTVAVESVWNTGATYAGAYRVVATLYDADGAEAGRASAGFTLVGGPAAGGGTLDGAVHTDRAEYDATATVVITGRVENRAGNVLLEGLTLHERVLDPAGAEIFQVRQPLPPLPGHGLETREFPMPLTQAAAGAYTVEQTVTDAQDGVQDRRTASFRVRSTADTGFGLAGTLTATPAPVPQGEDVTLAYTASNLGNADLEGLPLVLRLVDPEADTLLQAWPVTADLPKLGRYLGGHLYGTASLAVGRTYAAVLSAQVNGTERTLAQATFQVVAPPVQLDVTRDTVTGRVLALVSCQGEEDDQDRDHGKADRDRGKHQDRDHGKADRDRGEHRDEKDRDRDRKDSKDRASSHRHDEDRSRDKPRDQDRDSRRRPHEDRGQGGDDPPRNRDPHRDWKGGPSGPTPACLKVRRATLHRVLAELGVRHRIVTSVDAFRRVFRSGVYDTYWLSGGRAKLDDDLAREVREAVYRGDGLLIDGPHDERNRLLDEAGGFLYRGKLGTPDLTVAFTGTPFEIRNLPSRGRGLKLQLAGGQAVAVFPGGTPAVIRNAYGQGRSLAFGFDLPASLNPAARHPYWRDVVGAALADLPPPPPTAYLGGAYTLERVTIRNRAQAVTGQFRFRLPDGAVLADADPALIQDPDGAWRWPFDLPAAASRALDLGWRLPLADGLYDLTAHLDLEQNGVTRPYGDYDWQAVVATAQTDAPALRADLLAYRFAKTQDRQRRDRAVKSLDQAMVLASARRWDDALAKLLDASDLIAALPAPEAPDWRRRLGGLLREYEGKSVQASPP